MNPLKQIICLSLLFLAACHTQPQGGATATKSKYDWSTYKYANGAYNKLTKYCSKSDYGNGYTDSRTTLERSDDAAYQNWGSDWCMPTQAQFQELIGSPGAVQIITFFSEPKPKNRKESEPRSTV